MALCTSDIPMLLSSHASEWGTVDVGYLQRRVQKPLLVKACQRREPLLIGLSVSGCRRQERLALAALAGKNIPFLHQDISMYTPQ